MISHMAWSIKHKGGLWQTFPVWDTFAVVSLLLIATGFGLFWPRAHWTSIWMDREFSGWVAPISNRIHNGLRLYTDGGHSPMPPLSFILLQALTLGRARWIDESIANFICQWAALIFTFLAVRYVLPLKHSFLAAIVAIPIFMSLPKAILYDGLVQAEIAISIFFFSLWLSKWLSNTKGPFFDSIFFYCALLFATAAIMTKQSSGLAFTIGLLISASQAARVVQHVFRAGLAPS